MLLLIVAGRDFRLLGALLFYESLQAAADKLKRLLAISGVQ